MPRWVVYINYFRYFISKGAIVDRFGGDLNSTPLHWATRQGHLPMVVLLMSYGADPSLRDGEGKLRSFFFLCRICRNKSEFWSLKFSQIWFVVEKELTSIFYMCLIRMRKAADGLKTVTYWLDFLVRIMHI
jgi:hypothetical protein